ncbi:acyltransferase [Sporomusaceae bacterium FL31]|nr:acyltransferase [Sporomusaceae bacterium FL31]GCE32355.1 acyltransferase [Sporomusaceae bacterium]
MSYQRINAIEYIRGISMLGVIGIHTGAYSLANPFVNVHLFAVLEIFTRFSVPIFFFVSAFGLFRNQNLFAKLDYPQFMKRRLRTVFIPYIVWSLIYMIHYTLISGDSAPWRPSTLLQYLTFGLASYQLYFLVILLWFYSLMPLWRLIIRLISPKPLKYLGVMLMLQILFNYYSSYLLAPNFTNHYLNIAIQHRLSYWVIHYIFIFLLGGVCAVHYHNFLAYLEKYRRAINWTFIFSLTGILSFYYFLLYAKGYTPEQAVNTAHQLSPIGVIYTLTATLFFFNLFSSESLPKGVSNLLSALGKHSYSVYLVHPLVMYYLITFIAKTGKIMTAAVTITFYLLTVWFSMLFSIVIEKTSKAFPLVGTLLNGNSGSPKIKQAT